MSPRFLATENYRVWAIMCCCLHHPKFRHFSRIPTCVTRTDGQTHDDKIYRASIASRVQKNQFDQFYSCDKISAFDKQTRQQIITYTAPCKCVALKINIFV